MRLLLFAILLPLTAFPAGPLAIINATIQQSEDGAAINSGISFVPGETLFLSFQVEGYHVHPERKLRVSYEVDALDPQGVKLFETIESNVDRNLAPEDKDWKPKIRHQILIPPHALSGVYKVVIRAKDDLTNPPATTTKDVPFSVRSRDVAASSTLVVRNFRFYRSEEDRDPLATPAYRPGDTVWARFDITGYKLGPDNAVAVDYGISVTAPGGKVLYLQDPAAEERSSSFYPKRYVPGLLNLTLQPNIRPGQYGIILTVRDHITNQKIEHRESFSIE